MSFLIFSEDLLRVLTASTSLRSSACLTYLCGACAERHSIQLIVSSVAAVTVVVEAPEVVSVVEVEAVDGCKVGRVDDEASEDAIAVVCSDSQTGNTSSSFQRHLSAAPLHASWVSLTENRSRVSRPRSCYVG